MRKFASLMFAAAAMLAPQAVAGLAKPFPIEIGGTVAPTPVRRKKMASASVPRKYRSRGAQAKPAKRANMRHVSKRVRRKHRRAA